MKIHSSCEIEDFVEAHLCKLCVILRSRVLRVVCPHYSLYIIYYMHKLPLPPLQTRSLLVKTRPPFPSQLSDFVPLRNGFYSFRAQTD